MLLAKPQPTNRKLFKAISDLQKEVMDLKLEILELKRKLKHPEVIL